MAIAIIISWIRAVFILKQGDIINPIFLSIQFIGIGLLMSAIAIFSALIASLLIGAVAGMLITALNPPPYPQNHRIYRYSLIMTAIVSVIISLLWGFVLSFYQQVLTNCGFMGFCKLVFIELNLKNICHIIPTNTKYRTSN